MKLALLKQYPRSVDNENLGRLVLYYETKGISEILFMTFGVLYWLSLEGSLILQSLLWIPGWKGTCCVHIVYKWIRSWEKEGTCTGAIRTCTIKVPSKYRYSTGYSNIIITRDQCFRLNNSIHRISLRIRRDVQRNCWKRESRPLRIPAHYLRFFWHLFWQLNMTVKEVKKISERIKSWTAEIVQHLSMLYMHSVYRKGPMSPCFNVPKVPNTFFKKNGLGDTVTQLTKTGGSRLHACGNQENSTTLVLSHRKPANILRGLPKIMLDILCNVWEHHLRNEAWKARMHAHMSHKMCFASLGRNSIPYIVM